MNKVMAYKGYTGEVEVDLEAGVLFGRVLDIKDIITFQGTTVSEVIQAFHDSVDDYLAFCEEIREEPAKPFSGHLLLRTTAEHHHKIFVAAKLAGKSINTWMEEILSTAAEKTIQGIESRGIESGTDTGTQHGEIHRSETEHGTLLNYIAVIHEAAPFQQVRAVFLKDTINQQLWFSEEATPGDKELFLKAAADYIQSHTDIPPNTIVGLVLIEHYILELTIPQVKIESSWTIPAEKLPGQPET